MGGKAVGVGRGVEVAVGGSTGFGVIWRLSNRLQAREAEISAAIDRPRGRR